MTTHIHARSSAGSAPAPSAPAPAARALAAPHPIRPQDLADDAVAQVRRWLDAAAALPVDAAAAQLAGVLQDPDGLSFTVGFVDGVVRPEDLGVAARNLRALSAKAPAFLPWPLRAALAAGGALAPAAPGVVVPVARRVLREMVGHLIVDASDARLGPAIAKIRKPGIRLNMNLLGEAILGRGEASRRLEGTRRLLARDDVDYASIKVSSTVAPHNHWAFEEAVAHIVESLTPLYRLAASAPTRKFINLDMEEYKDLDLTIAVFTRLLEREEFRGLEAGIVLQAYLPDALGAMVHLQEWAAQRVAGGGAPIKVRVVKGANLPMEHVDAEIHGWPAATWGSKRETDTSYKAILDYALTPEHLANVRVGVAGHNLFDVALAWLLAKARGVDTGVSAGSGLIEFEMLLGMASAQAQAVLADVGHLLLYTPVVHPDEFDVAIAYLIRRLEEGASQENFMSAVFELGSDDPRGAALFEREKERFLASLEALGSAPFTGPDGQPALPAPNRTQDRSRDLPAPSGSHLLGVTSGDSQGVTHRWRAGAGFANTPDTDPDLPANRQWGRDIIARAEYSRIGMDAIEEATIGTEGELDDVVRAAASAGEAWGALTGVQRAAVLDEMGRSLERHRADLLEAMASETGKTLDQGDPEVSEAVDFAHYYATLARELDAVEGARFVPSRLTVVTPPWNFPVAIPAGSTLAALAAGSGVVIKPAQQARRSGAVMVTALWEALEATRAQTGVGPEVLRLVQLPERGLGQRLIAHPDVDRVILTGGYETAQLFRSFRPDLPLLAETSGKNAVIVTPSADLDLAAKDVAYSAFGHAGQKCSAASLVVLVGSVARSQRFRNQLVDAVESLHVGYPWDPRSQMGPVIEPPGEKLRRGLTELGPGEHWVLEPRQLDDSGKLWSPGVRAGVRPGSEYHLTEYFGPVLGVMTARTLEEAVELVNRVDYGLTSGLHSLDAAEIEYWAEHIAAGNLYVNRGITGAIVQRQPFGGWKKSAVGAGAKAGGPNYLVGLGSWTDAPVGAEPATGRNLGRAAADLLASAREELPAADAAWLAAALGSDAAAWAEEFGISKDVSALACERNVFRYRPVPVTVRFEAPTSGHGVAELLRIAAAGLVAGSAVTVSTAVGLPGSAEGVLRRHGVTVAVEDSAAWLRRAAALGAGRVRLIAGTDDDGVSSARALAGAVDGTPDVAMYAHPVVSAGRVELLPFLHEQAVSVTAHRFGNPNPVTATVRL
ncbi:RHH-type proline utilization regulon transcriptional repressor/proline dehydrogenase/delta 1-pyrroline-5-carboxylate dehydrogenase [Sinomonas atrocyanea]|uniref:bifunctional proline dehydrogenase/L-glutamate gamma-semialdehyde dehydrogenase n=1 Tax=Sinomonas atrocyanea TaxID=37927 RepID=UPI00277FA08D|nr:bifunctional proline dehydrogenase/L-glutamate gamma-semialdehyde dehydrogenase [Sinomonas atrocyanea]MDP9884119.1 RHH-type proline utilization regulon transcriptional repressor/proline dehydrogenase/delta 1-pyrroline-5-carboxylate dehydrogenase [Sinomonas atrocyanea]